MLHLFKFNFNLVNIVFLAIYNFTNSLLYQTNENVEKKLTEVDRNITLCLIAYI